jgi:hypothetical protein
MGENKTICPAESTCGKQRPYAQKYGKAKRDESDTKHF